VPPFIAARVVRDNDDVVEGAYVQTVTRNAKLDKLKIAKDKHSITPARQLQTLKQVRSAQGHKKSSIATPVLTRTPIPFRIHSLRMLSNALCHLFYTHTSSLRRDDLNPFAMRPTPMEGTFL
jgi:hypothetical protein